jgi:hypothetical protein
LNHGAAVTDLGLNEDPELMSVRFTSSLSGMFATLDDHPIGYGNDRASNAEAIPHNVRPHHGEQGSLMPHQALNRVHVSTILLIGALTWPRPRYGGRLPEEGMECHGHHPRRTQLHDVADTHPARVGVETLDITRPDEISALRERLSGRMFDILFVNTGTTNPDATQTIGEVSTEDFVNLMITNALSPMRVMETSVRPCSNGWPDRGHVVRAKQYRWQRVGSAGGLSWRQGGTEPAHALLCCTPGGNAARHAADGTGLGTHRPGRL